jgi:hypothetical protein
MTDHFHLVLVLVLRLSYDDLVHIGHNTGQSCCSVKRIDVHEKFHNAFVAAFLETERSSR